MPDRSKSRKKTAKEAPRVKLSGKNEAVTKNIKKRKGSYRGYPHTSLFLFSRVIQKRRIPRKAASPLG